MTAVSAVMLVLMFVVPASFAVSSYATVQGGPRWRFADRVDIVTHVVTCLAFLALARVLLPWQDLLVAGWGLAAALTAFGVLTSAFAVRRLPWTRPGRPAWTRIAGGVVNTVIGLGIVALTIT